MGEAARRLYRASSDEHSGSQEDFGCAKSTLGEGEGGEEMTLLAKSDCPYCEVPMQHNEEEKR